MTLQELETELLSLNPTVRLRIVQPVIQSLIPNATKELAHDFHPFDLACDRSPHHPLRKDRIKRDRSLMKIIKSRAITA